MKHFYILFSHLLSYSDIRASSLQFNDIYAGFGFPFIEGSKSSVKNMVYIKKSSNKYVAYVDDKFLAVFGK